MKLANWICTLTDVVLNTSNHLVTNYKHYIDPPHMYNVETHSTLENTTHFDALTVFDSSFKEKCAPHFVNNPT